MAGSFIKFVTSAENDSGLSFNPDEKNPLHQDDEVVEMKEVKNNH